MSNVRSLESGWYLVTDGDRQTRVAIAAGADGTWVFIDGQVARIDAAPAPGGLARARRRGDTGVMSPMPATVVSINTAAGQSVEEGETLIVLEAMKMELPIKAPRAGVVKAINCATGDLVQPGVNLIELE